MGIHIVKHTMSITNRVNILKWFKIQFLFIFMPELYQTWMNKRRNHYSAPYSATGKLNSSTTALRHIHCPYISTLVWGFFFFSLFSIFGQCCFPKTSIVGSNMNYWSSDWKFTSAISQNRTYNLISCRTLINCYKYHVQNHVMTKFKVHFFCHQFSTIVGTFLTHKSNWFSLSLWINFLPQ